MTITVGRRQTVYDTVAAKHVRDLFEGGPGAPSRKRLVITKPMRKARPAETPIEVTPPPTQYTQIKCPCCNQTVGSPNLDIIIDHYRLEPLQASILRAVWKGKGMPVQNRRIFDEMYADDPDGGPDYSGAYRSFKVALCRLRARLAGSGITIDNAGYGQGYRLILGDKK